MLLSRSCKTIAALLLVALAVPLFATALRAAVMPCCGDCPPPVSRSEPCEGSPLLACCDSVAAGPSHPDARLGFHPAIVDVATQTDATDARRLPLLAAVAPVDLAWLTSALRFSVVIRT